MIFKLCGELGEQGLFFGMWRLLPGARLDLCWSDCHASRGGGCTCLVRSSVAPRRRASICRKPGIATRPAEVAALPLCLIKPDNGEADSNLERRSMKDRPVVISLRRGTAWRSLAAEISPLPGMKWRLHDPRGPYPPVVMPSVVPGGAPSNAIVRFDGTDLSHWVQRERGAEAKTGLIGWAQMHDRNIISWEEKFSLDVWYVDHRSRRLDLWILARTVELVLCGNGIELGDGMPIPEFPGPYAEQR